MGTFVPERALTDQEIADLQSIARAILTAPTVRQIANKRGIKGFEGSLYPEVGRMQRLAEAIEKDGDEAPSFDLYVARLWREMVKKYLKTAGSSIGFGFVGEQKVA